MLRSCRSARATAMSGTLISSPLFRLTLLIVALLCGVDHVYHICSADELSTMICQDTHVVQVTCPAVVGVEKVNVLNSVLAQRFSAVLEIQWPQLDFCCKMNLIFKLRNAFMLILGQIACVFSIIAAVVGNSELREASQLLSCLSDFVYCTVCACMQTQHKIEMDKRDGMVGQSPMSVPPFQQMSRFDQAVPPFVGYPHA
ncbi:hypothetical protein RJT34_05341 [Clitoria ternatea]|uniref:Uncharacterized protein n=1 Tax=Clitoria ternatea TaxID=43366 RepID=A0AAN9K2K7_CLITE